MNRHELRAALSRWRKKGVLVAVKEYYIDPEDVSLGDMRDLDNCKTVEDQVQIIVRLTGIAEEDAYRMKPADVRAFRAALRAAWTEASDIPNGTAPTPSSPSATAKQRRRN